MKISINKQFINGKLHAVLSRVMKSHAVSLLPSLDMNHPFLQHWQTLEYPVVKIENRGSNLLHGFVGHPGWNLSWKSFRLLLYVLFSWRGMIYISSLPSEALEHLESFPLPFTNSFEET